MTRINLIPPSELHDKHLIAEYRELPRVVKLAVNYWVRKYYRKHCNSKLFSVSDIPVKYAMGTGHVTFFYNKYRWLQLRYGALCAEMEARGFKVNYPLLKSIGEVINTIPADTLNNECRAFVVNNFIEETLWEPSSEEIEINKARIKERLPL